ncbi:AFG1 family protein, putative [Babesia ovis]|uniref:AFG1 family protein, putative n=1 Tax=Babesia ovis TaxID=5869 RepID=A0A9W5WTM1_BABOV|nr:AFG1 family protein, putative [Babesia ovis]
MNLAYRIRSLVVDISGARKHELRDCIEKVQHCVSLARQQGREISSVEYAHIPRKRWRVTYLKSRFKHRKAIRHYVFERYTYRVSFSAPFDVSVALNSVLSSLIGGLRASCTFAWQFGSIPSSDHCLREDAIVRKLEAPRLPVDKLTPSQRDLCIQLERLRTSIDRQPVQTGWFNFIKRVPPPSAVRGMYIYGGVGQGKTVLMDAFYSHVASNKIRIHFHEFMIRVQRNLHELKACNDGDIMNVVAQRVVGDAKLLCLDEFFVNHISDAMILRPLFERIFNMGVVVVCTSNRPPDDLYSGGLNRDRFLPFIPLLKSHCDLFNLQAHDFRQEQNFVKSSGDVEQVYFVNPDNDTLLETFKNRVRGKLEQDKLIKVSDLRSVKVPFCSGKEAYFRFGNLCGSGGNDGKVQVSLGTEGFVVLSKTFHTFWISRVPEFDASNETDGRLRSFMLLIDVLYERNIKLFMSAKVPLLRLFGMVGILKIAENFQVNLMKTYASSGHFCTAFPQPFTREGFQKMSCDLGLSPGASLLLFDAILPPGSVSVESQHIWDVCENHRRLLRGLPPTSSHLYRFDVRDDSVQENEFACSRALSRLFHMSSGSYLQQHRDLFGSS